MIKELWWSGTPFICKLTTRGLHTRAFTLPYHILIFSDHRVWVAYELQPTTAPFRDSHAVDPNSPKYRSFVSLVENTNIWYTILKHTANIACTASGQTECIRQFVLSRSFQPLSATLWVGQCVLIWTVVRHISRSQCTLQCYRNPCLSDVTHY